MDGTPSVAVQAAARIAASAAAVAIVTAAIFGLRQGVPVLSLGVLYVFAVVAVAALWGIAYAALVALASMAAFNWFFLHPVHTFQLADRENWSALAVYVVTAIVVSDLAARARRRASEAEQREREEALLVELSTALLAGRSVQAEVERIASDVGALFGVARARIELGPAAEPAEGLGSHELLADGRRVGTLLLTREATPTPAVHPRFLSGLGSLLAVALDRERLADEALEAEALRRSDAIKTAVLRTVSHDLRTPLTAIRVAAEGLSSATLELSVEDRSGLLMTIGTEAIRLQRVVGDLLDLSRLQAGSAHPDADVWTVDELLSQVIDGLSDGGDRVELHLPDDTLLARVDAMQIERALANLLDNALKFAPPATVVEVGAHRLDSEIVIRVTDLGPGLEESERERMFEPFETGRDGERTGSGLGLAIARGFVEANGGRLWVESQPGLGTTFAVALPSVETPASAPA